jgi:hypothetical protein
MSDPREEPGALAAHVGICAGGEEQSSSLPRPFRPGSFPAFDECIVKNFQRPIFGYNQGRTNRRFGVGSFQ